MKRWIKNLFQKNKNNEDEIEERSDNKKYLVKKVIYEEILDKDELIKLVNEYNMQIESNTGYARRDGVNIISFNPKPPYKLEIEEIRKRY